MTELKEIEEVLKANKTYLRQKFKVKKIGIFGSFSRKQQTKKSDVDILVEFFEPLGWEFFDLKEYLEQILGKKVDLVTKAGLRIQMKDEILNQVIYI